MYVINNQCESSFSVLIDELKTYENLGLRYASGMALCKKNGDFASGFRKVGKDSKFYCINVYYINILLRTLTGRDYSYIQPQSIKIHVCCGY